MSTIDFVTELFCRIDDTLRDVEKHPLAHLHPSELVTIACLFAIKGVGNRQFYRWLDRDLRPLFPRLPERTRLFRLLKTHQALASRFLATPTLLGIIDSYGIELLHPWRYGRGTLRSTSERAWAEGQAMTLEQAAEYALRDEG